jgi:hypothetical protein
MAVAAIVRGLMLFRGRWTMDKFTHHSMGLLSLPMSYEASTIFFFMEWPD